MPLRCLALVALLAAPPAWAADFREFELAGEWYLLLHYTDDRSKHDDVRRFRDLGWSIAMKPGQLAVDEFPYVIFDDDSEVLRRAAMTEHHTWEPQGPVLDALREHIDVSSRAVRRKKLRGSRADGFRSRASNGGGLRTLTFSRDWTVEFGKESLRVQITDSLSSTGDLFEAAEAQIVYEFRDVTPQGDLVGTYREGHKSGSARLIRARERRIVR